MKYYFNTGNHTCTYIIALIKGFSSINTTNIATGVHVSLTLYSCFWEGPGASYSYSAGIASVPYCRIAASCIYSLLQSTYKDN